MIEFTRDYEFTNDRGIFEAHAKTYGYGDYGNGTSLEIRVEREGYGYIQSILLDIRYTGIWTAEEVDQLVRDTLEERWHASKVLEGTQSHRREETVMMEVEKLKAIYKEKEAKYQALCDAVVAAHEAHQAIKAMCDEAMVDMQKAGEELLAAMKE